MEISLETSVSHVNFKLTIVEANKLIEILEKLNPVGLDIVFVDTFIKQYTFLISKV